MVSDTHGDIDFYKLHSSFFPDGDSLTKNDYVIVCGDFGICWSGGARDKYLIEWYENKPWTTLFIDGNHENFSLLNSYPEEEFFGGKIHRISSSIIHLMRGQIYNIEGIRFFTMGGAVSIDKHLRKEGFSWWPQELPNAEEMQEGIKNLSKVNYEVDVILTHCAPKEIHSKVLRSWVTYDELNYYFNRIACKASFHHWFFGHYHYDSDYTNRGFVDPTVGNQVDLSEGNKNYHSLYDRIIEISH